MSSARPHLILSALAASAILSLSACGEGERSAVVDSDGVDGSGRTISTEEDGQAEEPPGGDGDAAVSKERAARQAKREARDNRQELRAQRGEQANPGRDKGADGRGKGERSGAGSGDRRGARDEAEKDLNDGRDGTGEPQPAPKQGGRTKGDGSDRNGRPSD